MRCPNYEVCVTPQLYGEGEKKQYVQDVCKTNEHKKCTDFLYSMFPKKGSANYRVLRKWLLTKKHQLKEMEKVM